MPGPQTKGILLVPVVADITKLIEQGKLTREQLATQLGPEALEAFAAGIQPISWYEPEVYRDFARVLMRYEGKGPRDMEYLRERGERAGKRLLESGLYQQLDYLQRRTGSGDDRKLDRKSFEQALRLVISMQAALMKGGKWSIADDAEFPDRFVIAVDEAEGLPEESAQAVCGILTGITRGAGSGFAWRYERPAPERVLYRMDRDIHTIAEAAARRH